MTRTASAEWKGGLKDGTGTVSTASQVLKNTPYSFHTRFEEGAGTNPEELVAASHAGCFAMAFSAQLGERGISPESIQAQAAVSLEKVEGGFAVTSSRLTVRVRVPGGDRSKVEEAANAAKVGCPISKLLKAEISMDLQVDV
jgi:osmotically inducible protein OsmC